MKGENLTRYVIVAVIGFWLLAIVLCSKAEARTFNVDSFHFSGCGDTADAAGLWLLTGNLSCPDVGLYINASNCTLQGQWNTITYGTDGGSGAQNWQNFGGTGIKWINVPSRGRVTGFKLKSGVTDTSHTTADTQDYKMTAIWSNQGDNLEIDNCSTWIYTPDSKGIVILNASNLYIHDVACSSGVVWLTDVDHDPPLIGIENGYDDSIVIRRASVIGRIPRVALNADVLDNSNPAHYTKIEGCYVEDDNSWSVDPGKFKNSYGIGGANIARFDTIIGPIRGLLMQVDVYLTAGASFLAESCYFDLMAIMEGNGPGPYGIGWPGMDWAFKIQRYAATVPAKCTVRGNIIKGQTSWGHGVFAGFSIDGVVDGCHVWADIYDNVCSLYAHQESIFVSGGGLNGYYVTCLAINEGDNARNYDSIKIWNNTFVTNNMATGFGIHNDGVVDSAWVGRPCSSNTFVRVDSFKDGQSFEPKFYTAYATSGCQGLKIIDAVYAGGASPDSIYLASDQYGTATLEFDTTDCGEPPPVVQKRLKIRVRM